MELLLEAENFAFETTIRPRAIEVKSFSQKKSRFQNHAFVFWLQSIELAKERV
jgi:hypothetical protein